MCKSCTCIFLSGRMAWTVTTSTAAAITLDNTTTTLVLNRNGVQVVTLPAASTVTRAVYIITNPTATVKTISTYRDLTGANVTTIAANSAMWVQSNGSIWQRIF